MPRYEQDGVRGVVEWASTCDPLGGSVALPGEEPPAPTKPCDDLKPSYMSAAKSFDPDVSVIVFGPSVVFDRFVDGRRLEVGTAAFDGYLSRRLDAMRAFLSGEGAGVMLATVPCLTPSTTGQYGGLGAIERDPKRIAAVNDALQQYAADRGVALTDLGALVCSHPEYLGPSGVQLSAAGQSAAWNLLATDAARARQ
jgi:hypothetical protein